jgi:hypothetical protein
MLSFEGNQEHLYKHLPGTVQSQKLLRKEGAAHLFNNKETWFFRKICGYLPAQANYQVHDIKCSSRNLI